MGALARARIVSEVARHGDADRAQRPSLEMAVLELRNIEPGPSAPKDKSRGAQCRPACRQVLRAPRGRPQPVSCDTNIRRSVPVGASWRGAKAVEDK